VEGASLVSACPLGRRIGSRNEFRHHWRASPDAALSRVAILPRGASRGFLISSGFHSRLGTDRCLLASAAIRLASSAKPVGADQALGDTALHHALEKEAQHIALTKAPARFFENVE
jgi:hypothetical protein